jgi:hypothetical protein
MQANLLSVITVYFGAVNPGRKCHGTLNGEVLCLTNWSAGVNVWSLHAGT